MAIAFVAAFRTVGMHTTPLGVALIAVSVATVAAFLTARERGKISVTARITSLDCAVAALTLWLLATTLLRDLPWVSSFQFSVFSLLPLGYLTARLASTQALLSIVTLLMALLVVVALVSIAYALVLQPINVVFPNHNNQAALLNIGLMLLVATALFDERHRFRAFATVLAFALATAVFLSGSRGAMLGTLSGLCMILLLTGRPSPRRAIPILIALPAAWGFTTWLTSGGLTQKAALLASGYGAAGERPELWADGLTMILQAPILGHGLGTTHWIWAAARGPTQGSFGVYLHNELLEYWLAAGFPAVLLLILVLFQALRATRARNTLNRSIPGWMTSAAAAGLTGLAVHSLFSYNLQIAVILLTTGVLLALCGRHAPPVMHTPFKHGWLPSVALLLTALPAMVIGTTLTIYGLMMPFHRIPIDLAMQNKIILASTDQETVSRLEIAARLQPHAPDARILLASSYVVNCPRNGPLVSKEDALAHLHHALANNPRAYEAWYVKGLITGESSDFRTAVELNPRFMAARWRAVERLLDTGRDEEAWRLVQSAIPYLPHVFPTGRADLEIARELATRYGLAADIQALDIFMQRIIPQRDSVESVARCDHP